MDCCTGTQNLDHDNSSVGDNERPTPAMGHWVHLTLDVKKREG